MGRVHVRERLRISLLHISGDMKRKHRQGRKETRARKIVAFARHSRYLAADNGLRLCVRACTRQTDRQTRVSDIREPGTSRIEEREVLSYLGYRANNKHFRAIYRFAFTARATRAFLSFARVRDLHYRETAMFASCLSPCAIDTFYLSCLYAGHILRLCMVSL